MGLPSFQRESAFMNYPPSNMLRTHRIQVKTSGQHRVKWIATSALIVFQAWDFSRCDIPDIGDPTSRVVVREAKIHNDASVDVSPCGGVLVTLVPSNLPMTTVVGVYSLRPRNLGQCYATYSLESSAVSVSLSPTAR